ncbi:hypothetical protein [Micromonospora pallida]|uniref:hypothetical protein n=1 Tax=Micromonospora pallida TaxID=145854 RepID=UPI00114CD45D|nr:hypothetical protein [Micromonospora pallida]
MNLRRKVLSLALTAISVGVSCLVAATPAQAAASCRAWYDVKPWHTSTCIDDQTGYFVGTGLISVDGHPSNCHRYRVYLVDIYGAERFSTGAWACSTTSITVSQPVSYFSDSFAFSRLKAFDTAGNVILIIDSPVRQL